MPLKLQVNLADKPNTSKKSGFWQIRQRGQQDDKSNHPKKEMQTAEFTTELRIEFSEARRKPLDPRRLQAGMFMDRPDLWRKVNKNRHPSVPPGQLKMFDDPDHIYLGLSPRCQLKPHTPDGPQPEIIGWGE